MTHYLKPSKYQCIRLFSPAFNASHTSGLRDQETRSCDGDYVYVVTNGKSCNDYCTGSGLECFGAADNDGYCGLLTGVVNGQLQGTQAFCSVGLTTQMCLCGTNSSSGVLSKPESQGQVDAPIDTLVTGTEWDSFTDLARALLPPGDAKC